MSVSICVLSPVFCASVSKMCPKVSKKPNRAHEDVMFRVKLDILKPIWYDLVGYFGNLEMLNFFHVYKGNCFFTLYHFGL